MSAVLSAILSKWGISVIVALVGVFVGKTMGAKYKNFAKQVMEAGSHYWKATRPGSPGGKALTVKEKQEFADELIDIIQAGVPLLPAKWSVK